MGDLASLEPGTYTLDAGHTEIGFVARHALISKVHGRFREFDGTATIAKNLADSSVCVVIQADSVATGNEQRDEHLRGAEFFGTTDRTITFTSTSVEAAGAVITITGDLTINGIAQRVAVAFAFRGTGVDPQGHTSIRLVGDVDVRRRDWAIAWGAIDNGGVLVSETVTLHLDVTAVRTA